MHRIIFIISILLSLTFPVPIALSSEDPGLVEARKRMVERDLKGRDIKEPKVLEIMGRVPRHLFVEPSLRSKAYADHPLPIGEGQTISQPYIVALMSELLETRPQDRKLEVGTGSGYQAAVLSGLVKEVFTIEIKEGLQRRSAETLERLGYRNVHGLCGDG